MDCLHAQQIISAALDREPVGADELAEAKTHCRSCAECARFVKGLAAVQKAGIPQPPTDLAERAAANAIAVVTREREAQAAAAAAAAAAEASSEAADAAPLASENESVSASTATAPADVVQFTPVPARQKRTQTLIALGAAAAVLVVFAGFAALWGIRLISGSAPSDTARKAGDVEMAAPTTAPSENSTTADAGAMGTSPSTAPPAGTQAGAVSFVEFGGFAYKLVGGSAESTATLGKAGTVTTSFDTGQAPAAYAVYRTPGSTSILVDSPSGGLAFAPVTFAYAGRTYTLKSSAIPAFGVWPTLPPGIAAPTSDDGSPTFVKDSSAGATNVYRLASGTVAQGVALPPNASESLGNPNWTWWTPTQ